MKTLITGVAGHIGANLVRALLSRGREVRVLIHRDDTAIRGLDVETARGSVLHRESLAAAVQGCGVVYHCAGKLSLTGDRDGSVYRTNVLGTKNVVEACLEGGVRRMINLGSVHAFSNRPRHGIVDEHRPLALGKREYPYDRSKALGLLEVAEGVRRGLDAVSIHPTGVVGPCDFKPSHMGRVMLLMYHHGIPALLDDGFHWVDVRDVAEAAIAAEGHGKTGESYIVSGHWATSVELAVMIQGIPGADIPRIIAPRWMARLGAPFAELYARIASREAYYTRESMAAMEGHRYISTEKAAVELGYRPRPLIATIRDTFQWFGEQGLLDPKGKKRMLGRRVLSIVTRALPLGFGRIEL
ncbi:MAG: NAD-dependent epimerase/dehydratase family protein [Spirochaetes bacterium]|nr:NAD-dependent epimerase/dehydratase family protein [Spirochaetota bacterium]